MKISMMTAAIAMLGLTSGVVLAQTALVEVDDKVQVAAFNATVDQVDDLDVYNAAGAKLGEVEEVVGTDNQTPTALIVDFEGKEGFADQDVVVPLDQFSWENDRLVLNADAATVGAMEVWKD